MGAVDNLQPAQFKYHSAPRTARADIAQHGIDWRRGPGANAPQHPADLAPKGNYLYHDVASSHDMLADGMARTHDTYEVNTRGLAMRPDPYQPEDAVHTPERIAPNRVRML